MRPAILLLAVAACSDLPPYQAECGNGVIDEHEDCDSGSGCLQCALPCDSNASCSVEGYVCGGDGLCHAPGGAFRSESQGFAFNASDLFVADVNGDRVGDVIGVGATSLLVHKGVLFNGLGPEEVIQTPFVTGTPAITRFDSDPSTDVVLPTAQSIVAYTSPLQALAPYPFALDVSHASAVPLDLFQFDAVNISLIGYYPTQATLFYLTIDITSGMPDFKNEVPICSNILPSQFTGMAVHDASSSTTIQKLVAITGGGQGCVINVTSPIPSQGLPPPAIASELVQVPAQHPLVLASISPGNSCPDLVDGLTAYPPSTFTLGQCGFSMSSSTDLRTAFTNAMLGPAGDEEAIGPVALAPYYIAGDAPEALATNYGVYAIGSSTQRLYHSDRLLDSVLSLDLDGDGDLDIAASAAGLDDIDFLYRFHPPAPARDGFQLVRYDTVTHPHKMFAADFDGNHATDLAYTEPLPNGERLMVAYGTSDRPLPPIQMSVFTNVVELTPGFANGSDPSGTLTDLSVLDYTDRPLLTLLHASPQRTLVPNFDPRVQGPLGAMGPDPSSRPSLAGVVAGHFGGDGVLDDLFSLVPGDPLANAYLDRSIQGAFGLGQQTPINYAKLATCGGGAKQGLLCGDHAHYLAWPLSGGDAIIGVEDSFQRAATFDYTHLTDGINQGDPKQGTLVADPGVEAMAPAGMAVHSLQQIDVDHDDTPELVVSYGFPLDQRAESLVGMVLSCHVDASGVIAEPCQDLSTVVADGDGAANCVDAASGLVERYQRGDGKPFPKPELVMVCHRPMVKRTDIVRIVHDASGLHAVPLLRLSDVAHPAVERIFLGDVTGDGIADLLVLDVGHSVPILLVYTQCNSRDRDPECL